MKKIFLLLTIFSMIFMGNAFAAFDSGSTGADGEFTPTENTELVLPLDGVFHFTTVNIPSGVTVTFQKNTNNTPVHILAQGDVIIDGTIDVSGKSTGDTIPGSGGPGGFNGGYGGAAYNSGGHGLGPGGGGGGWKGCPGGAGGGYATAGETYLFYGNPCGAGGQIYGNERIVPLIGGSGGGGKAGDDTSEQGGGGGGGAILIASSSTITINGTIKANGGYGNDGQAGNGSGGAIKLMADVLSGSGTVSAIGGNVSHVKGGEGRIRLEANTNNFSSGTSPAYTYGLPGSVFPTNEPSLWITSIAGVDVPAIPVASYANPDILLPSTTTNPVTVNVSAAHIPVGTTVTVSVIPQYGNTTDYDTALSGTEASSSGSVGVDLSTEYSNIIMAEATYMIQTAMYYDGEKIEKVRIATTMGKDSEKVYITESGKEIPAKVLKLAGLVK